MERQLQTLDTQKEVLQQKLAVTVQADRDRTHPLLLFHTRRRQRPTSGDDNKYDNHDFQSPNLHDRVYRSFGPAPAGTMTRLCEAIVSLPTDGPPSRDVGAKNYTLTDGR